MHAEQGGMISSGFVQRLPASSEGGIIFTFQGESEGEHDTARGGNS